MLFQSKYKVDDFLVLPLVKYWFPWWVLSFAYIIFFLQY